IRERLAIPERDSGGDGALVDQHPADAASETEARELDVARQAMFEARLGLIDEALARLERGEYGRCAVCGRPIPPERLELAAETPAPPPPRATSRARPRRPASAGGRWRRWRAAPASPTTRTVAGASQQKVAMSRAASTTPRASITRRSPPYRRESSSVWRASWTRPSQRRRVR